jgi:chemotaxis protein CheX
VTSAADTSAIDRETVLDVMADVWLSFLGDETIGESTSGTTPDGRADRVVATVCVDGPWSGVISFATTRQAGRDVAASLLAVDDDAVTDGDVDDAMGEVANVLGGNLKTLLPPPSSLSLPVVESGPTARMVPAGSTEVLRVSLDWRGEPVEVGVWESQDA